MKSSNWWHDDEAGKTSVAPRRAWNSHRRLCRTQLGTSTRAIYSHRWLWRLSTTNTSVTNLDSPPERTNLRVVFVSPQMETNPDDAVRVPGSTRRKHTPHRTRAVTTPLPHRNGEPTHHHEHGGLERRSKRETRPLSQPKKADSTNHNPCNAPRLDSRASRISTFAEILARGSLKTEIRLTRDRKQSDGRGVLIMKQRQRQIKGEGSSRRPDAHGRAGNIGAELGFWRLQRR